MTTTDPTSPPAALPGSISSNMPPIDRTHTIHIIDDDAPLGAALTAGLQAFGYQTVFSSSAAEGWTTAHTRQPDLILCDINMPGKNGHRLLQEIRADPDLGDCPFVFMTGNTLFAHPLAGMDLGADDFLLKPFTLDTLVACVHARLRRKEISTHGEDRLIGQLRDNLHKCLPHEFFTPLTGIMGFTELLEQDIDTMTPQEITEALQNIQQSGQRLHRTLRNYLFTLDRLNPDSATPFPTISPASVTQLIEQGALAAAKRQKPRANLKMDLAGATLNAGAQELAMLVEELVDNAFSFSRPGALVQLIARPAGQKLHLTVRDAGRGMTEQQIKVLGAFRQFDRKKYEQQGLGVGLFIVQQILRRMGGSLRIESTLGTGTTCHVMIPIAPEPA